MENTVIPAKIRGYRSRVINDLIDVTREINPLSSDSVALEQFTNGTMFHTRERKGIKLPFHFKVVANGTNTVLIYAGRANPIHGATVADLPMAVTEPAVSTHSYYDEQYELTMSDTGWVCLELDNARAPTTLTPVRKAAYPTATLFTQHLPIAYVIMSGGVITSCEQIYYGGDWIRQWIEGDDTIPAATYADGFPRHSIDFNAHGGLEITAFLDPTAGGAADPVLGSSVLQFMARWAEVTGVGPTYNYRVAYCTKEYFADWVQAEIQITVSQITDLETWLSVSVDSYVAALKQKSCDTYTNGGNEYIGLWRFDTGTNEAGVELDAESKIPFRDYDGSSVKTLGYSTKAEFATWIQAQLAIAATQITGYAETAVYLDIDGDRVLKTILVKT